MTEFLSIRDICYFIPYYYFSFRKIRSVAIMHLKMHAHDSIHLLVTIVFLLLPTIHADVWEKKNIELFCNKQEFRKTLKRDGCEDKQVKIHACLGNCKSYCIPKAASPYFDTHCYECKPALMKKETFYFDKCHPNVLTSVEIESAESCECKKREKCE